MTTLCFIDTETTGLHPEHHEIWEVACVIRKYIDGDDLERVRAAGGDIGQSINGAYGETSYTWQLPVDLARADLIALNIGHFHERRLPPIGRETDTLPVITRGSGSVRLRPEHLSSWAADFADLTWGAYMIGMVSSFDTDRLDRLVRRHGACPGWHYQPIDVETLAVGSILGSLAMMDGREVVATAEKHGGEVPADLHFPNRIESSRRFFLERAALPWDSECLSSWFGVDAGRYDRHTALGDVYWARDLWDAIHDGAQA